ncbi:MAG: tyrosine-protein phosphatase [Flavobacteriales bacterium]
MAWWDRFRSGPKDADRPDFSAAPISLGSALHIDVHSHMVPGVDDGAGSLEDSLAMIEQLVAMDYHGAVTTPHIHSDIYPNSRHTLQPAFARLQEAVAAKWPGFKLHLAAEYFLDEHLSDCIAADDLLWFPATDENGRDVKCVLFEFGFHEPPMNHDQTIFDLQMAGYTGVLAHAERYPYWHRQPDQIQSLADRGIWVTVNAASLAGAYGPEMYRVARTLLTNGTAKMICSDAHGLRHMDSLQAIAKSPVVQAWCTEQDVRSRGVKL